MAAPASRVPTLRHILSPRQRPLCELQRRWAQVHDLRFLATHHQELDRAVLEKYKEKLDRKVREYARITESSWHVRGELIVLLGRASAMLMSSKKFTRIKSKHSRSKPASVPLQHHHRPHKLSLLPSIHSLRHLLCHHEYLLSPPPNPRQA